jgi:hypothetical protein
VCRRRRSRNCRSDEAGHSITSKWTDVALQLKGAARRAIASTPIIPDKLHRNAPDVHACGPENTGSILMKLVVERLGLRDLSESDVLDVGCGVRFTQESSIARSRSRAIRAWTYTGPAVPRIAHRRLARD